MNGNPRRAYTVERGFSGTGQNGLRGNNLQIL